MVNLSDPKSLGKEGERLAAELLVQEGYTIVATSYRVKIGEIDIVAKDGGTLCFVEVKTRRYDQKGTAQEAVSMFKRRKLRSLAQWYLKENYNNRIDIRSRFDVVAVQYEQGDCPRLKLIRNAF